MTDTPAHSVALVLAAHGDRGGTGLANGCLLAHRDRLQAEAIFACVVAGVLKGEPSLDQALQAAAVSGATDIALFPMFMSDGYFAGQVLAERVAALELALPVRRLAPLGLDPRLPQVMFNDALAAAAGAGIRPDDANLLVVGHGSAGLRASAEATHGAAAALRPFGVFREVGVALLEEPPFVADVLANSSRPTVVVGFFSGDGLHAGEDIPGLLASAPLPAAYTGPIGRSPHVAGLILEAVRAMSRTS